MFAHILEQVRRHHQHAGSRRIERSAGPRWPTWSAEADTWLQQLPPQEYRCRLPDGHLGYQRWRGAERGGRSRAGSPRRQWRGRGWQGSSLAAHGFRPSSVLLNDGTILINIGMLLLVDGEGGGVVFFVFLSREQVGAQMKYQIDKKKI